MDWLVANWNPITLAITGTITVASIIAKLTPTKKDDEIIGKLMRIINIIAVNPKKPHM